MTLKVLVVDDATFVRDMVKRTVRQLVPNVELLEAPDGARAQGIIRSKQPDLILSDWEMPEMSGEDLLRWVREQPQFASTPFVMITSRGDRNHVMAAVEAGVSDYLSKPFTAEELTRKIGKQLKRMGYQPTTNSPANRGMALSSIEVLTGGRTNNTPSASNTPVTAPRPAAGKQDKFKGRAFLRFPHTTCEYELLETSLLALCGTMERTQILPTVFDQAAVDLLNESGEAVARLNCYVHSIAACEPSPEAARVRVIVRFVDQDPAKLQALSSLFE
jgi:DNA-binding response OmpR family regulator